MKNNSLINSTRLNRIIWRCYIWCTFRNLDDVWKRTDRWTEIIVNGTWISVMANQTADYYGDVYQWNRTVPTDEQDTQTEYYLVNWTDLVLAVLFCMLIVVTIVSNSLMFLAIFLLLLSSPSLMLVSLFSTNIYKSSL